MADAHDAQADGYYGEEASNEEFDLRYHDDETKK